MTGAIWTEWLQKFDCRMRVARRHVLLIIDNCPAHPKVSNLSFVEVVYTQQAILNLAIKGSYRHSSEDTIFIC